MCGIAGWLADERVTDQRVDQALAMLAHRGPDGSGAHRVPLLQGREAGLIHTRLAIIDLSAAAAQPMHSSCGKYVVIFNGEIYNYRELRSELGQLGIQFKTQSDTEVLLAGYVALGSRIFTRLVGMFAVAIIDGHLGKLVLARDHFGIKPLYYGLDRKGLYFASEVPTVAALSGAGRRLDLQAAHDYLALGQVDHSPRTFFNGIVPFPAAHFAEVDLSADRPSITPVRYWRAEVGSARPMTASEAAERLRELFVHSVRLHLRSDVPIGGLLSGGIDSSSVLSAAAVSEPGIRLRTLSYIAKDSPYSEEQWVDHLVNAKGFSNRKVHVPDPAMLADVDDVIAAQGEPFLGTSIYAQYRVFAAAAEEGLRVMLDGQGADEILGGYPSHRGALLAEYLGGWRWLKAIRLLASTRSQLVGRKSDLLMIALHHLVPDWIYAFARNTAGRGNKHPWIDLDVLEKAGVDVTVSRGVKHRKHVLRETMRDSMEHSSLPQLLRYADRNSMAHSIESRVPFLTPQLAEFVLSLANEHLVSHDGLSKATLRAAMVGIVPQGILNRRDKIGFHTPERRWLLSGAMATDQLFEAAARFPWLRADELRAEWSAIAAGGHFDGRIWRWINFLRWAQIFDVG